MRNVLIGLMLMLVGYVTQSFLLIIIGLILTVLTIYFEKQEEVVYEYVENKPKHILINSKPPEESITPFEEPSVLGQVIYEKEVKPIEDAVKKLRVYSMIAKGDTKKKIDEELEKAEKIYKKQIEKTEALPFNVAKEHHSPFSKMFRGIGINLSVRLISKIFDKNKKE